MQTDMAQPVTKLMELTNVCYLELAYPGMYDRPEVIKRFSGHA